MNSLPTQNTSIKHRFSPPTQTQQDRLYNHGHTTRHSRQSGGMAKPNGRAKSFAVVKESIFVCPTPFTMSHAARKKCTVWTRHGCQVNPATRAELQCFSALGHSGVWFQWSHTTADDRARGSYSVSQFISENPSTPCLHLKSKSFEKTYRKRQKKRSDTRVSLLVPKSVLAAPLGDECHLPACSLQMCVCACEHILFASQRNALHGACAKMTTPVQQARKPHHHSAIPLHKALLDPNMRTCHQMRPSPCV